MLDQEAKVTTDDVDPWLFDASELVSPGLRVDSTLVGEIVDIAISSPGWAAVLERGRPQVTLFDSPTLQSRIDSIPIEGLGSRLSLSADTLIVVLSQDQQRAFLISYARGSHSTSIVQLPGRSRDICLAGDRLFAMQVSDKPTVISHLDLAGRLIASFGDVAIPHPTLAPMASVGRIACSDTQVVAASEVFGTLFVYSLDEASLSTRRLDGFIAVEFDHDDATGIFTPQAPRDTTHRITRVGLLGDGGIWVSVVTASERLGRQVGISLQILEPPGLERIQVIELSGQLIALTEDFLLAYESPANSSIGVYHDWTSTVGSPRPR